MDLEETTYYFPANPLISLAFGVVGAIILVGLLVLLRRGRGPNDREEHEDRGS